MAFPRVASLQCDSYHPMVATFTPHTLASSTAYAARSAVRPVGGDKLNREYMKYLDYLFYVVAMITLLLSVTGVVMSVAEWRGIANVLVWAVAVFVSAGLMRIAEKELKELDDDEL